MSKKKRFLSLVMVMVMVFSSTITVSAAPQTHTENAIYYINNQTGEKCEAIVKEEVVIKQTNNEYVISKTADIYIPDDPSGIATCSTITDNGHAASISIDIQYTKNGKKYRLTGVKGYFKLLDSSFALTERLVAYTCQSDEIKGDTWKKYPGLGNFSYSGCDHWMDTGSEISYWLGGYAVATLSRGGQSWELIAKEDVIKNVADSYF